MKKFKCNVCGREFARGSDLVTHMRTHTGEQPFKCKVPDCGMAFKQSSTLDEHIKFKHSDERLFQCDFPGCRKTAKTIRNLVLHKKVHSDDRPFACQIDGCGYRAKWKCVIKRHEKLVHAESKAVARNECDFKTTHSFYLKRHMRRHSSRRDFKCKHPHCTETFTSSSRLLSHFSNRHGQKNIQCKYPGCGRKYSNNSALYAHRRFYHSNKSHACPNPECSYRTKRPTSLARHMIVHEGINEKIPCSTEGCKYKGKNSRAMEDHMRHHKIHLPCPVSGCGRRAPTKKALQNHLRLHDPSGRPFQCPLCFQYFQTLDQLQKHCVVHTNEKPFKCGHCTYESERHDRLRAHTSSLHANIPFPFIVHLPDDRECLQCKLILPSAEFLVHCKGHVGQRRR